MSVVDLTAQSFAAMEEARRRSEMVDAIYKTGTIIGLGTTFYMGWWLYEFFTNIQVDLKNKIGAVVAQDWPPVDPWLATADAAKAYEGVLTSEADAGTLQWRPGTWAHLPQTAALAKVTQFRALQSKIDPDSGEFNGYSYEYAEVVRVSEALSRGGVQVVEATKHPVDAIADFVVGDKWYWGAVLGLSAVPILSLGLKTLGEMSKDGRGQTY